MNTRREKSVRSGICCLTERQVGGSSERGMMVCFRQKRMLRASWLEWMRYDVDVWTETRWKNKQR